MSATARTLPRLTQKERRYVGLITFSHALQHVFFTALPITYPLAIREFGVSYATLGLVLSVAGVTGGLLQGAAGFYERASARLVFAVQNVLSAVIAVVAGAAPNFAVFAISRWAGSVITSPQHPVGAAVLTERFPERRGTVLSWHTTGGSIGTLAVPLVASVMITALGWRWTLTLFAIPLLLGAFLLWRYLPGNGAEATTEAGPVLPFWDTVLSRRAALLIAAATVAGAGRGLGSLSSYVPAYLHDGLHLGQLVVGAVYTVLLIGSVVGPLIAGYLSDRVGRRRLIFVAYLVGAAALVAFIAVGGSLWLLIPSALLVGVFVYSESPLIQSLYSDAVHGAAGRAAFGLYFLTAYGAGSLWLVVLGWVIDKYGFDAAFIVMAASFLPAAALVALAGGGRSTASAAELGG